jgi:7-cyano-7-deazaguanine tRNA-ribosyltransferase
MQVKEKDLAGRNAFFETRHGKIETPALFPVVNPIEPVDLKKLKPQAVMTNSYLAWKGRKQEALDKGIHKLIGFKGPVMTDSGAFQLMQYGEVEVSNKEIIEFQEAIGSDICTPLDVPGLGNRPTIKANMETTLKRAIECKELTRDSKSLWVGPLQGGTFNDLRKKAAKEVSQQGFDVYAVGSVVPLMNSYRFAEALEALHACKTVLPLDKPVHFFGAGHPMMFSFAVALGADLFDSAAYSLFAKKGKYLTVKGTMQLKEMKGLTCSCPVCSGRKPHELTQELLALHNLYASFEEVERIKEAIHENSLWELLEERSKSHPQLYYAFRKFKKFQPFLESLDVFTKKRFFVLSRETKFRPEVFRHEKRMEKGFHSRKKVDLPPFKEVPVEVSQIYPFGQRVLPGKKKEEPPKVSKWLRADGVARYVYGVGLPRNARVELSKTDRLRRVYSGKKLLASFRASDGLILPHEFSKTLHEETPDWRVEIDDEVASFARKGKTVFAKFVKQCDPKIRSGMDVLVVDSCDNLLASGTSLLSAKELIDFDEGPAVKVRTKF